MNKHSKHRSTKHQTIKKHNISSLIHHARNYLKKTKLLSNLIKHSSHPNAQIARYLLRMKGYGRMRQHVVAHTPQSFLRRHKGKILKTAGAAGAAYGLYKRFTGSNPYEHAQAHPLMYTEL